MITISDIAAKAGVSRATVSYVLNGRNTTVRISESTRQKVMATASDLGYHRNELARAVITGKNRMLGFWVMQSEREPVVRVLAGAMKEADAHGYFIKMLGFENAANDKRIIESCIEWRLSGIIAIHAPEAALDFWYPEILKSQIPLVAVDSNHPPRDCVHVASDQYIGIRAAVEHLYRLGHRKIICLNSTPNEASSIFDVRQASYRRVMEDLGLEGEVVQGELDFEAMIQIARGVLGRSEAKRPTAICGVSDYAAMAVIRAAAELRLRVPEDISVTGFDDLAGAKYYCPPLTTVAQSFEEMGRLAVRRLLSLSGDVDGAGATDEWTLPTQLIVRGSTAPA